MMDALLRLLQDREVSCRYYSIITGTEPESVTSLASTASTTSTAKDYEGLNQSQITAIESTHHPLSLVWGPPGKFHVRTEGSRTYPDFFEGTGKTTVVVHMLNRLIRASNDDAKILMTASTHNGEDPASSILS